LIASEWRADVEALAFKPPQHEGRCFVHRRAFATLLGFDPHPEQCAQYFEIRRAAFERAASSKLARAAIAPRENFHLTSRDIARELRKTATSRQTAEAASGQNDDVPLDDNATD
jgi:hypothetical protein